MRRGWMGWTWMGWLAVACAPDSEQVGVVDDDTTAAEATAGSTGTEGPASAGDPTTDPGDDDTAADDAADDAAEASATVASADDSTTSEPGTTDAGEDECIAEAWPACAVEACVQAWTFVCEACTDEFSTPLCFGVSEDCAYPWLDCAALPDSPCGRVWAMGESGIEAFEDEDAAVCVLEALRDGVPGTYEILWGEMTDEGWPDVEVLVGADGSAVMQWRFACPGCQDFGQNGRSGTLALQPTTYFDDCLAAPTTESLAQCIFGFVEYDFGAPPPDGWTPAFTTGECTALEFACPPG